LAVRFFMLLQENSKTACRCVINHRTFPSTSRLTRKLTHTYYQRRTGCRSDERPFIACYAFTTLPAAAPPAAPRTVKPPYHFTATATIRHSLLLPLHYCTSAYLPPYSTFSTRTTTTCSLFFIKNMTLSVLGAATMHAGRGTWFGRRCARGGVAVRGLLFRRLHAAALLRGFCAVYSSCYTISWRGCRSLPALFTILQFSTDVLDLYRGWHFSRVSVTHLRAGVRWFFRGLVDLPVAFSSISYLVIPVYLYGRLLLRQHPSHSCPSCIVHHHGAVPLRLLRSHDVLSTWASSPIRLCEAARALLNSVLAVPSAAPVSPFEPSVSRLSLFNICIAR